MQKRNITVRKSAEILKGASVVTAKKVSNWKKTKLAAETLTNVPEAILVSRFAEILQEVTPVDV